jgi:endonuclease/exonuclease/phosphatase family metal-dependent hydrolase
MEPNNPILTPIYERMTDCATAFIDKDVKSFPSDNPTIKIDYIFVSRDVKVKSASIPVIVASDHRPHVAEIE